MLGIALGIVPEAFAWGRRLYGYGGFGGGGFYEEAGTVGEKALARAVLKYLLEAETAGLHLSKPRARVRSSSKSIRASATPGPFSKVASIPRIPRVPGGPPPAVGAPQGGLFRGAAGGAALGAIGGAIGGNAGKGAAIGAATGAVFGGMRRRRWMEQEEFQQS